MGAYQTPGVYYERVDVSPPGVASALRTDVAGFVGIARRGPTHAAVPVNSWRQFETNFGGFTAAGYLAYAVRAFFENGGRRCWVVRVASPAVAAAAAVLASRYVASPAPAEDAWRVAASSPGVWGNDQDVTFRETHRAQTAADPSRPAAPEYTPVASVAGFARGTHVRVTRGADVRWKVVSDVDAEGGRLFWVHPKPASRLSYDAPLPAAAGGGPVIVESVEYTLLVRQSGRLLQAYEGLSLVPEHPRYGPGVLSGLELPSPTDPRPSPAAVPGPVRVEELRDLRAWADAGTPPLELPTGRSVSLSGGADGLALLDVHDFIGEAFDPLDSDLVRAAKRRGLRALAEVGEVSVVAVPDVHVRPVAPPAKSPPPPCVPDPCLPVLPQPAPPRPPAAGDLPPAFGEADVYRVQAAMVEMCERLRDRVALLDPPFAARDDAGAAAAARAWRGRFDSKYAAFYHPWVRVVDPLRDVAASGGATRGLTRDVPPTGHVAGLYARTDFEAGVHKAPANAPLRWAQGVTASVNDALHGLLNDMGVNVIRALPGRGLRVMGARTVSSDPDWRFVNVRRLLIMIGKAVDVSTQWAAFEPNDVETRSKLGLSLTSFLLALWQRGALAGATPGEAFFVRCDEQNNPPADRDEGRLLAEVGVAPSYPFEFVVLRVGRAGNAFEVDEDLSPLRAGSGPAAGVA